MARFSIYENTGEHAKTTPFLLDVQTDLLSGLETRVVIPLRKASLYKKVRLPQDLVPIFSIKGSDFALETPKMAAVPARVLTRQVASLVTEQASIVTALDFLFNGY
jgi:toxin CcdB